MSAFAELHDELRKVARDILATSNDWSLFAESGWLGLEVPEARDGSGATFAEVAVLLEEMGRAVTASPYLGTVVLGVGALQLAGADSLLTDIAVGKQRVAVAAVDGEPFHVERGRVSGRAAFVPDANDADRLLLVARDADGAAVLVEVEPAAAEVTGQPVLDETRRFAEVVARDVEAVTVWRFAGDPASLLDRAAAAIACDSLGVAEAMLDATVAYAKVREQFGRPIGSFQAVKHACADMLVRVQVGRELVTAAVDAVASGDPDAWAAASMAKAYVGEAAVEVAGKAMQLHGGIGYTWESGIHVHLKRAALNRSLFGSPGYHRRRLAQRYRGGTSPVRAHMTRSATL